MIEFVLAVLLVVALLLVVHGAMTMIVAILTDDPRAPAPIRSWSHAWTARAAIAELDREYEALVNLTQR
jgi:hypothetical protein